MCGLDREKAVKQSVVVTSAFGEGPGVPLGGKGNGYKKAVDSLFFYAFSVESSPKFQVGNIFSQLQNFIK